MTKLNIKKRLWINVSVQILMQALIGGSALWSVSQLSSGIDDFAEIEVPALQDMGMVDMYHDGLRGVAMESIVLAQSGSREGIADLQKESAKMIGDMHTRLERLSKLPLSKEALQSITTSKESVKEYESAINTIIAESLNGEVQAAISNLPNLTKQFEALEVSLGSLGEQIALKVDHDTKKYKAISSKAQWATWAILLVGILAGLSLAFFLIQSLSKTLSSIISKLREESNRAAESSDKISQSSNTLSSSAQEQSAAVHETVSTLDEISAMVKRGVEHAENTNTITQASLKAAKEGKGATVEMLSSIKDIDSANAKIMRHMTDSNKSISEIAELIHEISEKTKVINDIVFQTKLLSFNASVEAARAGEHGKGFAVVAEEVGNLAQMSGNAAEDIRQMLESSVVKVESIVEQTKSQAESLVKQSKDCVDSGISKAEQCGTTLDELLGNVEQVGGMMNDLLNAAQEQSTGVANISNAMNQFTEVTDSNTQIATDSLELSQDLAEIASALTQNIETLCVEVGIQLENASAIGSTVSHTKDPELAEDEEEIAA